MVKKIKKKVIILTGPSGAGKSTIAALLGRKGYKVLRADELAKELYLPGRPAHAKLMRIFGPDFFGADAVVDRERLGALVFSSVRARKNLNDVLYPALIRVLRTELKRSGPKVCLDMAVYFDAGAPNFGAKVLLVDAPLSLRVKRLLKRGLKPARARAQARALSFGPAQRRLAAAVLVNKGPKAKLKTQLNRLL